ncbi:hypothetical protein PGTUg99_030035 [Puccinia graminis f. sp. tritici]|uniref:Uncharacterized protein n=1 Tax=Puccinia graminis f. sp. tritici TaxID=56615 RepID=A0A5B0PIQ7_PUCGR|nr:hypothetical protein PGTUg99_030035 [Puccinia graminis f. sp. tritici]
MVNRIEVDGANSVWRFCFKRVGPTSRFGFVSAGFVTRERVNFVSSKPIPLQASRFCHKRAGSVTSEPVLSQASELISFAASRFRFELAGSVTSDSVLSRASRLCFQRAVPLRPVPLQATPFRHERVDFVSSEPVPFPRSPCDNDESTRGS